MSSMRAIYPQNPINETHLTKQQHTTALLLHLRQQLVQQLHLAAILPQMGTICERRS